MIKKLYVSHHFQKSRGGQSPENVRGNFSFGVVIRTTSCITTSTPRLTPFTVIWERSLTSRPTFLLRLRFRCRVLKHIELHHLSGREGGTMSGHGNGSKGAKPFEHLTLLEAFQLCNIRGSKGAASRGTRGTGGTGGTRGTESFLGVHGLSTGGRKIN